MTVSNTLYGVKDAANVAFFGISSGKLALDMDYANKFELSLKEDGIEYAKKGGKKAIKFDGDVEGELTISVDMMNGDLLAFINRSELLRDSTNIFKSEKIVVSANNQVVTPKETIVGFLGAYTVNADGTKKAQLSNATLAGGKVTLTNAVVGDVVKIYYTTAKEAVHFSVTGTKTISEDYIVYADVVGKQYEGGVKLPFQYKLFKVSPQSTVALNYDASKVASFEIKFDVLVDSEDRVVDYTEIPLVDEDVTLATPISNLIGIAGNTQVVLGFSAPTGATDVKVQYSTDSGSTWTDTLVGGSTGIRVASAILASTNQVTVLGLTNGSNYQFRISTTGGQFAGISNVISVTPTA